MENKTAIVTGASSGIGEAIARGLSARGARLILTARRGERLEKLAEELGGEIAIHVADIADPATPGALLALARARFGQADMLINNAGILRVGTVESFDLDALEPMIATNYTAVVRCSILFARDMQSRRQGSIVNISSIGAHLTAAGSGIYGGLKRALETFTDTLRIELAASGIRVGLVAPGTTGTEIFDDMKRKGATGWDEYTPPLMPEDVARAVIYLLDQPPRANVARVHVYASGESF
ncbi:SDR family oxidoreductase [Sphingomonas sp. 28-63-12]|uniref:SDR family oxidoreductase n=1 Tax=Sphingomonas sp. 28-63-12 TaxID=1970434 RepID=UPI0035A9A43A